MILSYDLKNIFIYKKAYSKVKINNVTSFSYLTDCNMRYGDYF